MSKSAGEKPKLTPADFDLRVRDRNLQNGVLDPKTVEKYLGDLPDIGDQCDTLDLGQPALGDEDDED
jgi:hypothetical protein